MTSWLAVPRPPQLHYHSFLLHFFTLHCLRLHLLESLCIPSQQTVNELIAQASLFYEDCMQRIERLQISPNISSSERGLCKKKTSNRSSRANVHQQSHFAVALPSSSTAFIYGQFIRQCFELAARKHNLLLHKGSGYSGNGFSSSSSTLTSQCSYYFNPCPGN